MLFVEVGKVPANHPGLKSQPIGTGRLDPSATLLTATPVGEDSGATFTDSSLSLRVDPVRVFSAVRTRPLGVFTKQYVRSRGVGEPRGGSVHTWSRELP